MKRNKKKYKALMLDLDGTTIPNSREGMPSKKVIEAITKAQRELHVSVVTGRPYYESWHIVKELKLSGPSIVAGGAEIRDAETGRVLWSKKIPEQSTKEVLQFVNKNGLKMIILDNGYYKSQKLYDPKYPPQDPLLMSIPDLTLNSSDKIINELKHFDDIAIHKILGWQDTIWLTITDAQANKQHGIFEVAKILGVETHDIIGVGEGYNDFPLLMACGFRVAMGNAVPELKEIADYIAPSIEDDGVADVIEKFVL